MARSPLSQVRAPHLLALEPRVMFDGAASATFHEGVAREAQARTFDHAAVFGRADGGLSEARASDRGTTARDARPASPDRSVASQPPTPRPTAPQPSASPTDASPTDASRQIIFIDVSAPDYQQLARDWAKQGEVVLIDKGADGLAQMEAALVGRSGLEAIHIVGHGEEGALFIGDTKLDEAAITGGRSQDLAAIGRALGTGGDILVYGCDFAEGSDGARALDSLARATGADVAASTDLTGSASLGGDWTLEARHGQIQARTLSDAAWDHALTPGPVSAVPISVGADSLTVTDANGAVVASGASTGYVNNYSPSVGVGATARWTNAATQNGQSYDLVATVVSVTGSGANTDSVQFLHPTGQTASNKPGDDPTFLLTDNSAGDATNGDGASASIRWNLVLTGTNTVAPADVTFNVLDIDGRNGQPNTRESVTAAANEVYYYAHETNSDIAFNFNAGANTVEASGTQDENNPVPTNSDLSTKSEASFSYKNTSGFTLTYTLAPANTVTRRAQFYHDGDSDFVYTTPVYASIPHLDLDGDNSTEPAGSTVTDTGAHFTFIERGASVPVVDGDVLVTNPMDINSIVSGSIALTNAKAGDVLHVGALPSNIAATIVNSAGTVTVNLSGRGSETDYQDAFKAITFENTSADPDTTQRVLTVAFTNDANYAASATSLIDVVAVNDAPVNTLPSSYTAAEDTALSLSGLSISDVDAGAGSETITLSVPTGAGTLAAASAGGVAVSGSGTGSLSLTGTLADLNAYLGGAATRPTFTGAHDASGPVTLTMVTIDNANTGGGGAQTDTDSSTITVTAVDDPPVNSLPSGYTTAEDGGPLSLGGISVEDVDAGSGVETITFSVPLGSGSLAAASAGGVTASGSGGTSITLSGTLSDLNAYLGAAATRPSFTSAPDFNGAVTLTMTTDDQGYTGAGGPQTDTDTSTITVTAVNDPPVNTLPASYAGAEETALSLSGISVADMDAAGGVETITLSVQAGSGALAAASAGGVTASGSGGTSITLSGTLTDLNAYLNDASTRPVFTGAQGRTNPVTLTVTTDDNGHTGAGGAKSDTDTSIISLQAVNHPPAATGTLPNRSAQDAQAVSYPTAGGFTDPDGDTLSYSATGLPAGLAIDPATGVISGTLDRSASQSNGGAYAVVVRATDPSGSSTQGFGLAVTDPAPTAHDDAGSSRLGTPVTLGVLANDSDPDGDPLTVTGAGAAGHGSVQVNPNGTLTYTPDPGYSGTDSFTYAITDGQGGVSSATVTVNVAADGAPMARPDQATTSPGAPVTVPVLANDSDPDGDPLTVTGATAGHGAVSVNPDGTLTYTPSAGFTGVDTITYTLSDGRGGAAGSTVGVTVQAAPDGAPRARPDQAATTVGTPVRVGVLANDTDPDNDPLAIIQAGPAQHGGVACNADGTLTYTPDAGFIGADSFTYTISDGRGGTATARVDVTVGPSADTAPDARPDTATTAVGAPVDIAVLANDADPDGDPLTITAVGPAQHGAVTRNADGTLTYTPAAGFAGSDSFIYTISDGRGGVAMSVVNVDVGAASDAAPVARRDQAATSPGAPVTVAVLANDSDPDGDPLTVTGAGAAHGAVTLNPDGTLTYTPNAGFTGLDTITYTLSDGRGGAAASTVAVTVGGTPNMAPVARPDQTATSRGRPVKTAVLANDTDADGDPITLTGAGAGHGAVTLNPDGTLTYTPDVGFSGVDTITYSIADGRGGTATSTVGVTVDGAPTARPDQAITTPGAPVAIAVLANDTDPEGDPLSVTRVDAADGVATLNPDGTITYTPNAGFTGVDTLTYAIADGRGGTATSSVAVTVTAPPTARPDTASTPPGRPTIIDVLANDSGPTGSHLAVTSATAEHGGVVVDADGTLTYSPDAGFQGADIITYAVSADGGPAATTTVTVGVGRSARPSADVDTLLAIGRVTVPGPGARDAAGSFPAPTGAPDRTASGSPAGAGLFVHDPLNGLRTLGDTTITRQAVSGAVDAVRWLDATSIDDAAPIAGEVARLEAYADHRDAGDRAFDPRWSDFAPKPLTGFSCVAGGDAAVMFDSVVRGGAIYLDAQDVATDGRAPICDFTVLPTLGGALPGWIRVDPRGLAIIERPADVDELHLVLQVTRRDGHVVRTPVVIQGATGEIEPDRRAEAPRAQEPPHGHPAQAAERHARLDHTLSTAKARRRREAETLHRSFR